MTDTETTMPVVIEGAGGARQIAFPSNATETAYLIARGCRFPRSAMHQDPMGGLHDMPWPTRAAEPAPATDAPATTAMHHLESGYGH